MSEESSETKVQKNLKCPLGDKVNFFTMTRVILVFNYLFWLKKWLVPIIS